MGKSTITVNLALALHAEGLSVGLLDADIYGPSQQHLLGVPQSQLPDQRDGKWLVPIEAYGLKTMSMAYLTDSATPMVWRGPMASSALSQLLEKTIWGDVDILLVDMPPGTGDIQLTLTQKISLSGVVVVTTPQEIALIDARKGIEMFKKVEVPVLGVLENMAAHSCPACGHSNDLFGTSGGRALADHYAVPLLGSVPLSKAIREQSDIGQPIYLKEPGGEASKVFQNAAQNLMIALRNCQSSVRPIISMGK